MDWIENHPRIAVLAGMVVLCGALYGSSLGNGFVLDDVPAVQANPHAHWPPDIGGILSTNYWGSPPHYRNLTIYRPLSTLSFALVDGMVPGEAVAPGAQRAVNILLHALAAWLVALLVLAWIGSVGTAWAGGILFAVHPVHSEAVLGVVSRAELLAAVFALWAVLNHLGWSREEDRSARVRRGVLGVILVTLAIFSKENGATVVVGLLLVDGLAAVRRRMDRGAHPRGAPWWTHLGSLAVLGGYLLLRSRVLSGVLAGDLDPYDNPLVDASVLARVLTPFKILLLNCRLLVAPVELTWDYSYNHVPVVSTLWDGAAWSGIAIATAMTALLVWAVRRDGALAACLALFAATYSVASNIVFLSTILMAERLLYLSSAFFLGALAVVGHRVWSDAEAPWCRRWLLAALVLVSLGYSARTAVRIPEWEDGFTLAEAGVRVAPDSAKARHFLGHELAAAGQPAEAIPHYRASLALDPTNFLAHFNLGLALHATGQLDAAFHAWEAALLTSKGTHESSRAALCTAALSARRIDLLQRWCTAGGGR
ncbi:MAG: tetratricopeptide repeat protein [Pseudomonadota bacterium]